MSAENYAKMRDTLRGECSPLTKTVRQRKLDHRHSRIAACFTLKGLESTWSGVPPKPRVMNADMVLDITVALQLELAAERAELAQFEMLNPQVEFGPNGYYGTPFPIIQPEVFPDPPTREVDTPAAITSMKQSINEYLEEQFQRSIPTSAKSVPGLTNTSSSQRSEAGDAPKRASSVRSMSCSIRKNSPLPPVPAIPSPWAEEFPKKPVNSVFIEDLDRRKSFDSKTASWAKTKPQ